MSKPEKVVPQRMCIRFGLWLTAHLDSARTQRKFMGDVLVFLSLRVIGIEISFNEVKSASNSSPSQDMDFSTVKDADLVLTTAKDCYETSDGRRTYIIDKCKALLTLASLFLALFGYLLPKGVGYPSTLVKFLIGFSLLLFVHAIVLLLQFFEVGTGMEIGLDADELGMKSDDLKVSLAKSYIVSRNILDGGTNYLVDLYRAARFFVFSALVVSIGLFSFGIATQTISDPVKDFANTVRGDQDLTNLIRGPKGDMGPRGAPGAKGDPGPTQSLNFEELIKKIEDRPKKLDSHVTGHNKISLP